VKLLIDECLSPDLVEMALAHGHLEATHVTRLGLTSAKDWTIARRAVDDGFVFVTNNTVDFLALYGREGLYAGLICLNAAPKLMSLALQKQLFSIALGG
jgi:predicted nuclease of predicted toxin-antitoxin system